MGMEYRVLEGAESNFQVIFNLHIYGAGQANNKLVDVITVPRPRQRAARWGRLSGSLCAIEKVRFAKGPRQTYKGPLANLTFSIRANGFLRLLRDCSLEQKKNSKLSETCFKILNHMLKICFFWGWGLGGPLDV